MSRIDEGTHGAKRATWHAANPRELIRRIVADHPKQTRAAWRKSFIDAVEEDARQFLNGELDRSESYFCALLDYTFANAMGALLKREKPSSGERQRRKQVRAEASASVRAKLRRRVQHEAKIILLNLGMPNGKPLGRCTGDECNQFGGWFVWLAKLVPPKQLVADTLTEDEVRKVWQVQRER